MAIKAKVSKKSLKLMHDAGKENGVQKYGSRTYNSINPQAADEMLHKAGTEIAKLIAEPVLKYVKIETSELIEG